MLFIIFLIDSKSILSMSLYLEGHFLKVQMIKMFCNCYCPLCLRWSSSSQTLEFTMSTFSLLRNQSAPSKKVRPTLYTVYFHSFVSSLNTFYSGTQKSENNQHDIIDKKCALFAAQHNLRIHLFIQLPNQWRKKYSDPSLTLKYQYSNVKILH